MNAVADELIDAPEDKRSPLRQCIVTREVKSKDELLRFVLAPDGRVVPDLAQKLPGRGMWLDCSKDTLDKAIRGKLFARAAKQPVDTSDLIALCEQLLYQRVVSFLSLARKSGDLVAGFEKVREAAYSGLAIALVHADDAGEDGIKKMASSGVESFPIIGRNELAALCGREDVAHVALLDGSGGQQCLKEIKRFTGFMNLTSL